VFPVLLELGPIPLHTYGVMIALGFMAALSLAQRRARQVGVDDQLVGDVGFWLLVWGLVGARVLFIIVNIDAYAGDPAKFFRIWEGGLVFYGGFLGALGYFVWTVRKNQLNAWQLGDIIIPSLAIGHAFGRIGCVAAGCCWGRATGSGWGFQFPSSSSPIIALGEGKQTASLAYNSVRNQCYTPNLTEPGCNPERLRVAAEGGGSRLATAEEIDASAYHFAQREPACFEPSFDTPDCTISTDEVGQLLDHTDHLHPVQLYESFGELSIFFILVMWRYRKTFHGQIFLAWLVLYPILRTINETFFRGDKARGVDVAFGLSTSGLISVIIAVAALIVIGIGLKLGRLPFTRAADPEPGPETG
jgi:prolipoprotein diacylglyceryltransferase